MHATPVCVCDFMYIYVEELVKYVRTYIGINIYAFTIILRIYLCTVHTYVHMYICNTENVT